MLGLELDISLKRTFDRSSSVVRRLLPGFTMVQLLVGIAIIGILASTVVLITGLTGPKKARDAERKAHLRAIAVALESHEAKNVFDFSATEFGFPPDSVEYSQWDGEEKVFTSDPANGDVWIPGLEDIIKSLPKDPKHSNINSLLATTLGKLINFSRLTLSPKVSVQAAGTVGLWHLDGDATDSSGNGNNGTLQGGMSCSAGGILGTACSFDGSDDYIQTINESAFDGLTSVTVSAWINPSANKPQGIVGKSPGSTSAGGFLFYYDGNRGGVDKQLEFWVSDGSAREFSYTGAVVERNIWTFVTGVWDSSTSSIKIYVDGTEVSTTTTGAATGIGNNNYELTIGAYNNGGSALYDGTIDEVTIWDRALSPSEIQDLFNPTPPTTPVSCSPSTQPSINVDTDTMLEALDGDGSYNWTSDDPQAVFSSTSGSPINVQFPNAGTKTVTVSSDGNTDDCVVEVTAPPPPTTPITANNISGGIEVDAGDDVTIAWNSTDTNCSVIPGGWSGPTGSQLITITAVTIYNLNCDNSSSSVQVNLTGPCYYRYHVSADRNAFALWGCLEFGQDPDIYVDGSDPVCESFKPNPINKYNYCLSQANNVYRDYLASLPPPPPSPNSVSLISASVEHNCALLNSGKIQCWGNSGGYLGDGTSDGSNVPVDVLDISDAIDISVGKYHTCAVLTSGSVQCWGWGRYGQLGNGIVIDGSNHWSYAPVDVLGISDAIEIGTGNHHSCAVLTSGSVQCWGWNNQGQLGDGTNVDSSIPVNVSGISSAIDVGAGGFNVALGDFSCAVLNSGGVQCWGDNGSGLLGDGTYDDSNIPVDVSGISDAIYVSAGNYHSCALLISGGIKCWGLNYYGQFGDGTYDDSNIPVDVLGISDAIDVGAGAGDHTCTVLSTGEAKCWGWNWFGSLGDGTNDDSNVPVDVSGISDAIDVGSGENQSCAVLTSGGAQCWGWNLYGQLGNGTNDDSNVPVDVLFP